MSIHFISGRPGGGKTLYALHLIKEELVYGSRPIITNLPLKLGELNAYLQREYPNKTIDLASRVFILSDEQVSEFYTYRPGFRLARLTKQDWFLGRLPDYSGVTDDGVMYVLDELHNFFGARQWLETGRDVLYYLSQHRHLGDTVICITQAVANVDKQFRSVAQDFTYIKNMSKVQWSRFRMPAFFLARVFPDVPGPTSEALSTHTFRCRPDGLAGCYDTAAGVGIHGRMADRNERKKGIHWSFGIIALGVLLVAFFWGGKALLMHLFGAGGDMQVHGAKIVASSLQSVSTNVVSLPKTNFSLPHTVSSLPPVRPILASVGLPQGRESSGGLWIVGKAELPGKPMRYFLSDGRTVEIGDRGVVFFPDRIVSNGQVYEWR